jgi:hypothetical protein
MTDLDVELNGLEELIAGLENLEEKGSTDAVYEVSSTADYSVPLEFGRGPIEAQDAEALRFRDENGDVIYRTSVSGHPPYPFFRPALREFQANPDRFLRDTVGITSDEAKNAQDLLRLIGLSLETQIKINSNANQGGRSPGTHPDHPVVDTGNLRASISSNRIR